MDPINLLLFLLIGATAGWIANNLMRGRGLGVIGNMVIGVIGAFVGGFAFALLMDHHVYFCT